MDRRRGRRPVAVGAPVVLQVRVFPWKPANGSGLAGAVPGAHFLASEAQPTIVETFQDLALPAPVQKRLDAPSQPGMPSQLGHRPAHPAIRRQPQPFLQTRRYPENGPVAPDAQKPHRGLIRPMLAAREPVLGCRFRVRYAFLPWPRIPQLARALQPVAAPAGISRRIKAAPAGPQRRSCGLQRSATPGSGSTDRAIGRGC